MIRAHNTNLIVYLSKTLSPFGCDINGKNNMHIFAPNIIILRSEVLILIPLIRVNSRLTKESYIADILTKQVLHLCVNRRTIFMHDNAPPHQAHLTKTLKKKKRMSQF